VSVTVRVAVTVSVVVIAAERLIAVVEEVRESKLIEKRCLCVLRFPLYRHSRGEERRGKQSRMECCRAKISRDDVINI
jgi:hypothetical protein